MKLFIYKILTAFILVFILYKLTIGHTIRLVEQKMNILNSKENIEFVKKKIRNEIKNGLLKDRYMSKDDAILINDLINKIKKELETN
jgi:hypothetical protein|tara:strand:- start:37 stop:297 length:261 start_codon:yes stop_codon:yes gene_type:complete